jgi:hypothetical protein
MALLVVGLRLVDVAAGPALHFVHVRRYELQVTHPSLAALGTAKALFYQVAFGGLVESLPMVGQGVLGPQFLDARWALHGVFTSVA